MTDLTPYAPLAASLARRLSRRYPRLDPWDVSSWVWEMLWRATGDYPGGAKCYVYREGEGDFAGWVTWISYRRCGRECANRLRQKRTRGAEVGRISVVVECEWHEDRRVEYRTYAERCVKCLTTGGDVRTGKGCTIPDRKNGLCSTCYARLRWQKRTTAC